MPRAFLSHSSSDKWYVNTVVEKLPNGLCVYDEYSFEEGMGTLEEIERGLEASDLFVIFLSDIALERPWVKEELSRAHSMWSRGFIQRIYPIIIDKKINHSDKRIPDWMRDEFNLKLVTKPVKAKLLIEQRLKEISWKKHPVLLQKEKT